jgi:hypothetical protein
MTTTAHNELRQLDEAIEAAEERLATTRQQAAEKLSELPGLHGAEGAAWAEGREDEAERIRKKRAALLAESESWRARIAGAERAATEARAARAGYVAAHGDTLAAELADQAEEHRQAVEAKAREFIEAVEAHERLGAVIRGYVDHRRHPREDVTLTATHAAVSRLRDAGVRSVMPTDALRETRPVATL